MTSKPIGFVGGGRVTRILLGGWQHADCLPQRVLVSDPNDAALEQLHQQFPTVALAPGDNAAAAAQDIVFLAVHPPAMMDTLQAIRGSLRANALLISLAPKFTITKLSELLDGFSRIVRSIPNAPSLVGHGFNPLSFAAGLGESDRNEVRALFGPLGVSPTVDEPKLEVYAVLTAMGPTYFWPQLIQLIQLGEEFGVSEVEAREGLEAMLAGSMATLAEGNLDAEQLLDLIPVKPLDKQQPHLLEAYRQSLTEIFQKIRP